MLYLCIMKTTTLSSLVKFIIAYCNIHGFTITPLKLQKILYYTQSWHIAKFDKHPLFSELPEAWVNGPVYRTIYDNYKSKFFKSEPLKLENIDTVGEEILETLKNDIDISDEQFTLVNSIVKFYSSMGEGKLVLLTHRDTPWNEARKGLGEFDRCENKISIDSMYQFYNPLMKRS